MLKFFLIIILCLFFIFPIFNTKHYEKYENNDDKQVISALKTTIISLRIQLGQGSVPSDFSDDFPFLPLV